MSVLKQMNSLYNELKPVQKIIADYFLATDFESLNASIEDVSRKTGTSVASVSRFCKKLGYDNFQHFKISLSRDLKYEPDTVLPLFNIDDDARLSIRKVFSEAIANLQATEEVVSFEALEEAAERIIATRSVFFFGLGGSGKVGGVGEVWFSHIGYATRAVSDPYEMIVTAGHAGPDTNIVALSHSGRTVPVLEAVQIAKQRGACIIGITNYRGSPLSKLSNVLLLTACPERRVHFAQSNSMVAQSTILRALYIIAASRSGKSLSERVNEIEVRVQEGLRRR